MAHLYIARAMCAAGRFLHLIAAHGAALSGAFQSPDTPRRGRGPRPRRDGRGSRIESGSKIGNYVVIPLATA